MSDYQLAMLWIVTLGLAGLLIAWLAISEAKEATTDPTIQTHHNYYTFTYNGHDYIALYDGGLTHEAECLKGDTE